MMPTTTTKRQNPEVERAAAELERTLSTVLPHLTPEWRANARAMAEQARAMIGEEKWQRLDMLLQFHGA